MGYVQFYSIRKIRADISVTFDTIVQLEIKKQIHLGMSLSSCEAESKVFLFMKGLEVRMDTLVLSNVRIDHRILRHLFIKTCDTGTCRMKK